MYCDSSNAVVGEREIRLHVYGDYKISLWNPIIILIHVELWMAEEIVPIISLGMLPLQKEISEWIGF